MEDAVRKVETAPIYFSHDPMFTPDKLYRTIKKFVKSGPKVQAVFFDYIKIPTASFGKNDKWAVVGDLAYGLKAIASSLDIPVITAVQVNRDGSQQFVATGEIDASSFALSDMIEQAASVAMVIRPLNKNEEEEFNFIGEEKRMMTFAKNRHSSTKDKILFSIGDGYVELTEKKRIVKS